MATPGVEVSEEFKTDMPQTEEEREALREELKKTEDEIQTLRQVLVARQKHAQELKRKLGLNPLSEFAQEVNQGLEQVKKTQAFQKTSEVVTGTAETVSSKLSDIRNSNLFKSFETKIGTAYNSVSRVSGDVLFSVVERAKMAASTSIDQLAGHARGNNGDSNSASNATSPKTEQPSSPLS
uniref:Tumor protein D52 n=1 Tax=Steinernema glaseri TaxID=37863 RepID=A0A1I8AUF0_9BILA